MVAYMNAESLARTIETGEAWYWSRSRQILWRKGETSGQLQRVVEMRTDCDQDALIIRVEVGGDGGCCHTGRRFLLLPRGGGRRGTSAGAFGEGRLTPLLVGPRIPDSRVFSKVV